LNGFPAAVRSRAAAVAAGALDFRVRRSRAALPAAGGPEGVGVSREGSRRARVLQPGRIRARRAAASALALALAGLPIPGGAEETARPEPNVPLDQLLRIPDHAAAATPRRGGATRSEWQGRFRDAQRELDAARAALEQARAEVEELASEADTWSIAAPGVQPSPEAESAPLSYRLHQELRTRRDAVDRAERTLQELVVEANLAGVPPEWQKPAEE
jgi:hypothetical protein